MSHQNFSLNAEPLCLGHITCPLIWRDEMWMKSGPGQMKKLNNKGRQREVYKYYYCFSVIEWSKKGEEKKSADGSFHDWFLSLCRRQSLRWLLAAPIRSIHHASLGVLFVSSISRPNHFIDPLRLDLVENPQYSTVRFVVVFQISPPLAFKKAFTRSGKVDGQMGVV